MEENNHAPASAGHGFRLGVLRFSAVELLATLALLFVTAPFIEGMRWGDLIEAFLATMVLVAAVLAVGGRRRALLLTTFLMSLALIAKWGHHILPHVFPESASLAFGAIFIAFIILNLLRFVLRTRRVNNEVLCAGISAYLMLGLCWSLAYRLVENLAPGSFAFKAARDQAMEGFTALYYSFMTLSTVGYGDITPVSNVARMLATLESMVGTLYVAVLVARLVSLYSASDLSARSDHP
jgi:hypothetical protein